MSSPCHAWKSTLTKDAYIDYDHVPQGLARKMKKRPPLTLERDGSLRDSLSIKSAIHSESELFFLELELSSEDVSIVDTAVGKKNNAANSFRKTAPIPQPNTNRTKRENLLRSRSGSDTCLRKQPLFTKEKEPSGFLCIETGDRSTNIEECPFVLPKSNSISRSILPLYCEDPELVLEPFTTTQAIVMGGTPEKLTMLLLECALVDRNYIREFLSTFSYFTSSTNVLKYVKQYYTSKDVPSPVARKKLDDRYLELKQQRVEYVLYVWMKIQPRDFCLSENLSIVTQLIESIREESRTILLPVLSKVQTSVQDMPVRGSLLDEHRPSPYLSGNSVFMESTILLAQQLCLMDQELFFNILSYELKNQAWTKKDPFLSAPNVTRSIEFFNRVSYCCATEILSHNTLKQRIKSIQKIIELAERCAKNQNYNMVFATVSCLNFCHIDRLKKTWKGLPSGSLLTFQKLQSIVTPNNNYENYKKLLLSQSAPIVPYLGVFLRDLTFIEVGNSTYLDGENTLVNFDKFRMVATTLQDIISYQQVQYEYKPLNHIRSAFCYLLPADDEEILYNKSVLLEPRTPAKKKSLINRLIRN